MFDLHPDTEPAAVRAAQLEAVRESLARLGPDATPEQVSEDAILPAWNVRRLMTELSAPQETRP